MLFPQMVSGFGAKPSVLLASAKLPVCERMKETRMKKERGKRQRGRERKRKELKKQRCSEGH